MNRLMLATALLVATGVSSASSTAAVQAPQVNEPGKPTVARMFVLNRDRSESIPVTVQGSAQVLPVEVVGAPSVTLAPATVIGTRAARQGWEYRTVTVAAGQDAAAALNAAGADGWEAVGPANAGANSSVWILKRPR